MSFSSMRGRWGARLRTRFSLLSLSLGIAFGAVPLAVTPLVVSADAPTGIGFTLLGCNGSESLLPAGGPYVCPDANYGDGNQGKDWNELDLVPMRLVATANGSAPATQTYQVATVADYLGVFGKKSYPGFDFMSVPVLNTALSDASCAAVSSNPAAGSGGTLVTDAAGDTVLYRLLSITQAANTTCVYDYYQRVALGASGFPGSSLHSFLGTAAVSSDTVTDLDKVPGVKTIPVDVNPSAAPSLAAALSATQGAGYVWTVAKSATPNPVDMANTCNSDARSITVDVTLSWTRQQVDQGSTAVVESVYADNPTGRALTASATATLLDASHAQVGSPDSTGNVTVPANSSHYLLGSFTHGETAGASSSYSLDVSGSFTDPVTHQAAGGNPVTASANAAVSTVVSGANANAVVTDVAGISGSNLEYSIDSVTGPAGSLGSYVLGTPTTGSVTWTSPSLSGDGTAVLHETVYATGPTAGTGSLDDQAHVTSGEITTGINLQVPVNTAALFGLTIDKTIPDVLQGAETASFGFTVTDAHGHSTPASIDFSAGQTSGSASLSGLAAGTYTVHENAAAGWAAQPDQTVVAAVPTCSDTVSFANTVVPAVAAVQKTTIPAGHEAGWKFTLTGPGLPAAGETATTNASGALTFSTPLQEGEYLVTETSVRSGWVQGSATGCDFTVDYPADGGRTFTCDVTNLEGTVSGPQGGVQAATVTVPDTGAGLPYLEALLLVLAGGGLAGWGWLRSRRNRRMVLR